MPTTVSAYTFIGETDALAEVVGTTLSVVAEQDAFRKIINQALGLMDQHTGRDLFGRSHANMLLDSVDLHRLAFPEWPLVGTPTVSWIDLDGTRTAIDLAHADYDRAQAVVILRDGYFPLGEAKLEATATLGYDATDHPTEWSSLIELQVAWIRLLWQRRKLPQMTTSAANIGAGAGATFRTDKVPPEIRGLMLPFERRGR